MTKAYNKVCGDLIRMGILWRNSRLDLVPCYYKIVPLTVIVKGWMGWWDPDEKVIHFPSVYLPVPYLRGQKSRAVDVLRHEFGHALADLYPGALKKGGTFRAAFGGAYGEAPAEECVAAGWGDRYVSEYATSATQEDFAETFMLFVKHKGKIPAMSAALA